MVNFIDYYVDGTNGSDTYNGRSWGRAKATINAALALCSGRALNRVWVAPGGYNEDVVTPLNATAPFGQLIAWNPTPFKSFGGTYIYASTSGGNSLTIRARGWLVDGFEIGVSGAGKSIVIGGATAGNNGGGAIIQNCIISGWGTGIAGIDFQSSIASNAHVSILNNFFDGFNNAGNTAVCIQCSNSGIDQPRYVKVLDNLFADSDNYIAMNPRGMKESEIKRNTFLRTGANYDAVLKLDNRGGNGCMISQNALGDTYDNAGGYYPGSNEDWYGNYSQDGITTANPAA
jgi:hypothetical protein